MSATSGKARFLALCAALLLAAEARAANPSAADVATARELYKQGADALDAGNARLAADKLSQAWALVQTPVIGLDLARAQSALGHLVEAREAALSVQRLAVAHDETPRSSQARSDAVKMAAELEPRIPHVLLDVRGLAGHEATVKLDGQPVPTTALSVARQANPGPHVAIVDTDDGRHAEGTTDLAERESKTIVVQLEEPHAPVVPVTPPARAEQPPALPTPPPALPTPPPAVTPERGGLSPVFWIGVATVSVGLATGAITGAFAMNEASTVQGDCTVVIDGTHVCGPADTGHLATANALATISTVGFVVAGVGVAVLVTGLLLPSRTNAPKPARLVPFIGPVSGVRLAF